MNNTAATVTFNTPTTLETKENTWDPSTPPKINPQTHWTKILPNLLRFMGAAALLLSVSVYLLQGWGQGSDLNRFFLLLGHTVFLAVMGLVCSRWLKEQKGARLLLMIMLVFISANFAILGGFFLSLWGSPVPHLHGAVTWVIGNSTQSILLLTGALAVLIPLAWFGFTIAARRSANAFTLVFLVCNLALLIPTRNEWILGGIMLTLLTGLLVVITKIRSQDVTLATYEGWIARLILFVPLGIMLGRNMMHSMGAFMPFVMSVILFIFSRHLTLILSSKSGWRAFIEMLSVLPILVAAVSATVAMDTVFTLGTPTLVLIFALVASVLLFELSLRACTGQSFYSVLASLTVAGCFMVNLISGDQSLSLLVNFLMGTTLAFWGFFTQRKVALIVGLLQLMVTTASLSVDFFQQFPVNNWFCLAALGVSAIVFSSYVEKRGETIKLKLVEFKSHLSSWGY